MAEHVPKMHPEGERFVEFIRNLLKSAGLNKKYVNLLTDESGLIEFTRAFTSKEIDPVNNYEFYEIMGDATTNKVVVSYFKRRFPDVFSKNTGKGGNMGPVAIMARLKQNGINKKTYGRFAKNLGFWEFIRASEEERKSTLKLMEDTFEAFCGCMEELIDNRVLMHSGYSIVYQFMQPIMDREDVSLKLEDLYDQKSRVNEEIHKFHKRLTITYESFDHSRGNLDFLEHKENIPKRFESQAIVMDTHTGKAYKFPSGFGPGKKESQQLSAKFLLDSGFFEKFRNQHTSI